MTNSIYGLSARAAELFSYYASHCDNSVLQNILLETSCKVALSAQELEANVRRYELLAKNQDLLFDLIQKSVVRQA